MPGAFTIFPCANRGCTRRVPQRSTIGLCWGCERHWRRFGVPTGGFIGSSDLQKVAGVFLKEVAPTKSEITAALRILRGKRYREGPWENRPAYRLQPLLHGSGARRLPHLLVGRRKAPSMRSLGMALCHYHLANTVLGTRGPYSQFLAGATFYCRRSPVAPSGADILTGGAKSAGYRLHVTDYSAMGREVLKAGKALGVHATSREVSDRITSIYLEGFASGRYRPAVLVPYGCYPSPAPGDHPLDHYHPDQPSTDRRYRNKVRRASGMIGREWPEGLDLTPEDQLAARLEAHRKTTEHLRVATTAAPSTDWLGF